MNDLLFALGVFGNVWPYQLFKKLEDFAGFGVPAGLLLGIERFIIDKDFKSTFAASDDHKIVNDVLVIGEKVLNRTHGAGTVVSGYAVFNRNVIFLGHSLFPPK